MISKIQHIKVLHPDHPLMKRFQDTLKATLLKHNADIDLKLRELNENSKKQRAEREEVGVNLYEAQQVCYLAAMIKCILCQSETSI